MKDIIIVGGGPGAMSAAIYAARRKLDVLMITEDLGGYVSTTDVIENYLGFETISGIELAKRFEAHVRSYPIDFLDEAKATNVFQQGDSVTITMEDGSTHEAKTVIIATGSRKRKLPVPEEEKFLNKGLTYCTICDGPLFQDQEVAVIGGGDSGIKAAAYLNKIAKKVYVLEIQEKVCGEPINIEKLHNTDSVEILTSARVKNIVGTNEVEGLIYVDVKTNEEKLLKVSGIAVEIGILPNSHIVDVKKNHLNQIIVDDTMRTSSDRIFAVGDVNNKGPEQIIVAAGQGCIAALEIDNMLQQKG